MKLSKNFLKDYINIDKSFNEIAEDMLKIGNEYESVSKLINSDPLVIGKIIEAKDHPDSDHLHVCKVDIKKEILQIVCGAPNVKENMKVIVSTVGTKLPGGEIKKSIIRGVESNGMMVAIDELGLDHKFLTSKDIDGIHEFDENAPIGENALEYLNLEDEVIDFDLTANRGDLLSVLGFAYEIGAKYNKKVILPETSFEEKGEDLNNSFCLNINTDKCFTFLGKRVNNIKIEESPLFIKNRLIASGIRPINNVVDISNYVMLETGQPLHFYDADKVKSSIGVRSAKEDEVLMTLDEKTRKLSSEDLVIVNEKNEAIGLAGVMGGYSTEVENDTKNILIESAIFDPFTIRKTSKKVLRSEASNRFEKGLDVNRCYLALKRSCLLLEKYANGEVQKGTCEYNTLDKKDKEILITSEFINRILGLNINEKEIIDVFDRLGFETIKEKNSLLVKVPTRRIDINIKEDLVEEVGRIYGVDNITGTLPMNNEPGEYNKFNRDLKTKLSSLGLNEVYTYTLVSEKEYMMINENKNESIKILDPMTEERVYLRNSIIPSLLSVYEYNKARGQKDLSIYEISRCFKKEEDYISEYKLSALMTGKYYNNIYSKDNTDFYTIKGILEETLDYLGYSGRYSLKENNELMMINPYQGASIYINNIKIGFIGKIHPSISKEDIFVFEINLEVLSSIPCGKMKYREISKYPSIEKDLTFILKNIKSKDIIDVIKKSSSNILKSVYVNDIYNKDNVTYKLIFESSDRTLTDEEVLSEFNKIIDSVLKKYEEVKLKSN